MSRAHLHRFVAAAVFAAIAALPVAAFGAAPDVAAFTEAPAVEEEAPPVNDSGIEPAVEVIEPSEEEEEQPWTARFLAPTLLLLGVLGLIASIAYYVVRIRGRYRVVRS